MAHRRRLLQASFLAVVVAALAPVAALGGGGGDRGRGGAPAVDLEESVLTPAQAANLAIKEAKATEISAALAGAVLGGALGSLAAEDPWDPPTRFGLDTRPRQQAKWFWCGPAAGQVVINWSRGVFSDNLNGENATTNWRKQSTLAAWMGTDDQTGTWGGSLAATLNRSDAVLKPVPTWIYSYRDAGTLIDFHGKVVTDVWAYRMPLVAGTAPHLPGSDSWLPSWPRETNAHHYIVISSYAGLTASTGLLDYLDSSKNFNGGTGRFETTVTTMYRVIKDNQGKVIW